MNKSIIDGIVPSRKELAKEIIKKFEENNIVVIYGEAGSGKTFLCQYIYCAFKSEVVFNSNKNFMLISNGNDKVQEYNLVDNLIIRTYIGNIGKISRLEYSPDEKLIIVTSSDGSINIWDRYTGELLKVQHGKTKEFSAKYIYLPNSSDLVDSNDIMNSKYYNQIVWVKCNQMDYKCIQEVNNSKKCLFIFDGFDEATKEVQQNIMNLLSSIKDKGMVDILVNSRFRLHNYYNISLRAITRNDIKQLLSGNSNLNADKVHDVTAGNILAIQLIAAQDLIGEDLSALNNFNGIINLKGESENDFRLLKHASDIFYNNGFFDKSLSWCFKALSIINENAMPDDFIDIYLRIANIYQCKGEYSEAMDWYKKILVLQETTLDTKNPNIAITCNNIAGVYDGQGDYPKALEWYQKALDIREKSLGNEHPDTATTYNNIASVFSRQGDYSRAMELYHKALDICEKILGKEHPDTATTYNNIAFVYSHQGDYPKALEWYQRALDISEKVWGKDHSSTAATYNNIAGVYSCQGYYSKALEWYQKALFINKKMLGEEHPDTASTYNNIAGVYSSQGNYFMALEWYQKALDISEKILGKEHPDTATTYNNIAGVYTRQGDYSKALEWYQKALDIFEVKLGPNHPYTKIVCKNMSSIKECILRDKILICKDCGKEFLFTVGEQAFYKEKGFENEPERCTECRRARKKTRDCSTFKNKSATGEQ